VRKSDKDSFEGYRLKWDKNAGGETLRIVYKVHGTKKYFELSWVGFLEKKFGNIKAKNTGTYRARAQDEPFEGVVSEAMLEAFSAQARASSSAQSMDVDVQVGPSNEATHALGSQSMSGPSGEAAMQSLGSAQPVASSSPVQAEAPSATQSIGTMVSMQTALVQLEPVGNLTVDYQIALIKSRMPPLTSSMVQFLSTEEPNQLANLIPSLLDVVSRGLDGHAFLNKLMTKCLNSVVAAATDMHNRTQKDYLDAVWRVHQMVTEMQNCGLEQEVIKDISDRAEELEETLRLRGHAMLIPQLKEAARGLESALYQAEVDAEKPEVEKRLRQTKLSVDDMYFLGLGKCDCRRLQAVVQLGLGDLLPVPCRYNAVKLFPGDVERLERYVENGRFYCNCQVRYCDCTPRFKVQVVLRTPTDEYRLWASYEIIRAYRNIWTRERTLPAPSEIAPDALELARLILSEEIPAKECEVEPTDTDAFLAFMDAMLATSALFKAVVSDPREDSPEFEVINSEFKHAGKISQNLMFSDDPLSDDPMDCIEVTTLIKSFTFFKGPVCSEPEPSGEPNDDAFPATSLCTSILLALLNERFATFESIRSACSQFDDQEVQSVLSHESNKSVPFWTLGAGRRVSLTAEGARAALDADELEGKQLAAFAQEKPCIVAEKQLAQYHSSTQCQFLTDHGLRPELVKSKWIVRGVCLADLQEGDASQRTGDMVEEVDMLGRHSVRERLPNEPPKEYEGAAELERERSLTKKRNQEAEHFSRRIEARAARTTKWMDAVREKAASAPN